ncbi:MAG: YafY family transcriptional regulator [Planctomycetes bacterium]|nr:YafY family transcriptional regulator [Planctomycetota bacterium]
MDLSRLHRVLRIVTLLQTGRTFNAAQLAAECRVSRRTVYRDLAAIEKVGIPFFYNHAENGYQMHATGLLPPINLTLEEALALVLMATELGRAGRLPLFQPARDAAAKIESTLPLGLRAVMGRLVQSMAVRPGPVARHNALQESYRLVQRAVARREAMDAIYISFHDQGQIRTRLEPYWLVFHERAWYVIGRSSLHGEVRTFKLGRFKNLALAGRPFKPPKDLSLEKHLGNAWGIMRGKQAYEVELKFSPLVGPNVAEVNWHKTQRLRWDEEGAVYFSATVDGLDEIVWWVVGYGPEVEVLKPPELRDRVRDMARRMVRTYERA